MATAVDELEVLAGNIANGVPGEPEFCRITLAAKRAFATGDVEFSDALSNDWVPHVAEALYEVIGGGDFAVHFDDVRYRHACIPDRFKLILFKPDNPDEGDE